MEKEIEIKKRFKIITFYILAIIVILISSMYLNNKREFLIGLGSAILKKYFPVVMAFSYALPIIIFVMVIYHSYKIYKIYKENQRILNNQIVEQLKSKNKHHT